jgi:GT2 family glycosyltransferase
MSSPRHVPTVSILIVGYRNLGHLSACIGGATKAAEGVSTEILFIDCSNDGSEHFVRENFPEVRVAAYEGNLGFGRGNNRLAREATGEYILLLNPDTVPETDEIARLVAFARSRPEAGAWGGRVVTVDGRVDPGCHQGMISSMDRAASLFGLARGIGRRMSYTDRRPQRIDVVTGAFLLMRRSLWEQLGGFDERFFMYAEEVDLCKRIADAGYPLWSDPSIVLKHDSGSGDAFNPQRRINRLTGDATFLRKHHGPAMAFIGLACSWLIEARRVIQSATVERVTRPGTATARTRSSLEAIRRSKEWWNGWPTRATH